MQRLPIIDAEVYYDPQLDFAEPADRLLARLIEEVPWRSASVRLWGQTYTQPRLVAWVGDPGCAYRYSGTTWPPLPWTPLVQDIRARTERACAHSFNGVLLNYYRDHRDSMGLHSDDERELGRDPVIASVSFGEERKFVMKPKRRGASQPFRMRLASGSLLVMRGSTQHHWKHGIEKQSRACGPRVNLTFRQIVDADSELS